MVSEDGAGNGDAVVEGGKGTCAENETLVEETSGHSILPETDFASMLISTSALYCQSFWRCFCFESSNTI